MFKVTAYRNGKVIKEATVEDPKEIPTLNMVQAMVDAAKSLREAGIAFDELTCSLVNLSANVAKLNDLFLAPDDPSLAELEAVFNQRAKDAQKTDA